MSDLEPAGTYRPQYRLRWRGLARVLDRAPRLKRLLAEVTRRALARAFEPGMVTTERVVEYPFVFQSLDGTGVVLDVGCCHSRLPIALASRGFRVVGLDVNAYPHAHPNLRVVRGDIMSMPFGPGTFDAVLAISVIEHIGLGHYTDPRAGTGDHAAVREIARVLRPGGRAVITVPFGRSLTDSWKRVYDRRGLRDLLAPLASARIEYAIARSGVWRPGAEAEAEGVDWSGPDRAVALVRAVTPAGAR